MKQITTAVLLCAFAIGSTFVPGEALAKNGDDDDRSRSSRSLEIEADVFTDMTIVNVELVTGKKTTFRTDADTKEEVIDVVAERFGLSKTDVAAALDFDIEDRASRTNERAKLTGINNRPVTVKDKVKECVVTTRFKIEVDVFTDTTIVKVEKSGTTTVFETTATTSAAVVEVLANKYPDLSKNQITAVLDFDIEDRESRSSDFSVSSTTSNDCTKPVTVKPTPGTQDEQLRARIAELQKLIENLMKLLNLRLGSGN